MLHLRGRSRWTVLPLVLSLPLLAGVGTPAAADVPVSYTGYLVDTGSGTRYVVNDAADASRFWTSPVDAVDGAVGYAGLEGPAIAYVVEAPSGATTVDRLHLVRPDGSDTVVYTAPAGAAISEPALARGGRSVLFAQDDDTSSAVIEVIPAGNAVRTIRRSTTTTYSGPSYSPDATYVSWVQETGIRTDVVTSSLYAGGTEVVASKISETSAYVDASWSPDGSRLLAVSVAPGTDGAPIASLESVNPLTRTSVVLVRGRSSNGVSVSYLEPAWSPGGRSAYATELTESDDAVTGTLVRLPDAESGAVEPVAAPGYAGSPSAAGPPLADDTAPGSVSALSATRESATAHLSYALPDDRDVAELIVTRSVGAAADTPTASIEVARTRSTLVDVALPAPGTEYGISVFARDWAGHLSPATKLSLRTPPASAVSISTPPARVTYRGAIRFTGRVTAGGTPVHGGTVALYVRRANTTGARPVTTYATREDGTYTILHRPEWTAEYYVRFEGLGAPEAYPSISARKVVSVVPLVSLTQSASRTVVGRAVTLTAGVAPNHAGQLVSIQRYVGGMWRTIGSARLSSTSTVRYALRPGSRGTWTLRVLKPADRDHLVATSPTRTLYVG